MFRHSPFLRTFQSVRLMAPSDKSPSTAQQCPALDMGMSSRPSRIVDLHAFSKNTFTAQSRPGAINHTLWQGVPQNNDVLGKEKDCFLGSTASSHLQRKKGRCFLAQFLQKCRPSDLILNDRQKKKKVFFIQTGN